MSTTDPFADIRPYRDDEVAPVLQRLLQEPEFIAAAASLRLPRLSHWLPWLVRVVAQRVLQRELGSVTDVKGVQVVVKHYMDRMIEGSTSRFTVSGLEQLDLRRPMLFMSNHRDIALDPALVNYALYHNGGDTVRIAIGDNLLSKPYAADLMRLNKSFIVRRSAKGPRQMMAVYKTLSAYIRHSLQDEKASIWLAQREGRAKDGNDMTERAIIKMLAMSQDKQAESLSAFIAGLNIVPVSISYEWDPCDGAKARELTLVATTGIYQKAEHEDLSSIATGIRGDKGHVHVAFGRPLRGDFESVEAVAAEVDRQVLDNYVLHPCNFYAYLALHGGSIPPGLNCGYPGRPFAEDAASRRAFEERMAAIPQEFRAQALAIYANPVRARQRLLAEAT